MSDVNPLPPGWDAKYDSRTGKRYFINYFTQKTTIEDPRKHYRQVYESVPMQELGGSLNRPSPITGRNIGPTMGAPALQYQQAKNAAAETTLEQSVAKISAMFPTVGETHIKTLLIKYLKSVFPVVEETLLLDTLCNSDNNVHRATEQLMTMGFNKRDTPPPRVHLQKKEVTPPVPAPPPPPPRMKSVEEKQLMKERLQQKNPDIPERVVSIALDSVDYDEDKAAHILDVMQQDDKKRNESPENVISEPKECESKATPIEQVLVPTPSTAPISPPQISQTANNQNRRCKGKKESPKINREISPIEKSYQSPLLTKTSGANPQLQNGPNIELLLPDYATWTGPNQELVRGANRSLIGGRVTPRGTDAALRKGPVIGLAKGSIYSRLTTTGRNESRGK